MIKSEITAKRKELKESIIWRIGKYCKSGTDIETIVDLLNDYKEECKEEARKDFLDWLIELKQNQSFGNYVIEVARKIEEIKKSLANGEKT